MKQIRLLIVDDSPTQRVLLKHVVESSSSIKVVGLASDGEEALDFVKKNPCDVILMDIQMPRIDGFEATRRIMSSHPIPIIICSSYYTVNDMQKGFQAIQAGALLILEKPKSPDDVGYQESVKRYTDSIEMVSEVKMITRTATLSSLPTNLVKMGRLPSQKIEAIAFGASLGGPQTLQKILSQLTAPLPVPLFIVQHIGEGFAEGFAKWLRDTTAFKVKLPIDGEKADPGNIYMAPAGAHMEISVGGIIRLIAGSLQKEPVCPSITRFFNSMAKVYGKKSVGIILTGMGRDGVEGLLTMKTQGAITVAQSDVDCIMYGMPKEAILSKAATHVLPLNQIPSFLSELLRR